MDPRRALPTHQALETFLQTQKALLERTNDDIARLQKRRQRLLDHVHGSSIPQEDEEDLEELGSGLSHLSAAALTLPPGIDWAAFERCDPTPLHALSQSLVQTRTQNALPSKHQRSPLSPLQQLVKDARVRIIDPILSQYPPGTFSEPEEDSDDGQQARARARDPMEERRRLERDKIRELKKRKIHGNSVHEAYGGLSLPKYGGNAGVFVRRDMQDESAEVDVTLDDSEGDVGVGNAMDVDMDDNNATLPQPSYVSSKGYAVKSLPFIDPEPAPRARKPTAKVKSSSSASHLKPKPKPRPPAHAQVSSQRSSCSPPPESTLARPRSKKPDKPKPETYKQAWSVEEQHHLEQLLEQIPDGEKNRWQKISLAMDGRRTPRQVASRVQKYFEKLKRFGM
ncbi:hypothetical protein H0H92_003035 [Tricholoma furcatifolium]|nr:hypothetical protein H0H92_003035 [Tricholoma furcatifolium]